MNFDPGDFTPEALAKVAPVCIECGTAGRVTMVKGDAVYPHRHDLADKLFWRCGCGAYCGCHGHTMKPLGTPAGPATRRARSDAHAAFDPLWKRKMRKEGISQGKARGKGYKWLAEQLGMATKDCHIAMMDRATALRVVEICKGWSNGRNA